MYKKFFPSSGGLRRHSMILLAVSLAVDAVGPIARAVLACELFGLGLFIEHPLHRWAYRFVRTMDAAYPATGPTHSFFEFRNHSLNMFISCFLLLDCYSPADPLVACQWREVFPTP